MILVTFTLRERKTVESVDANMTIAQIASNKGIGANEKIYINGKPVDNRSVTLGEFVDGATSCAFNVITKTNNAR